MKKVPAWVILCVIALVAGAALGATNALTKDRIAEQAALAAEAARAAVLPAAVSFEEVDAAGAVDSCYKAVDASGNAVGYTALVTVQGFGGPIEVTVGVDANGALTGIQCGGSAFSETAGLGAKVKDAAFTDQFAGLATPVALTKNGGEVDSVTAASISSGAVCDAVNAAAEFIATLG
ncbi:MAG: FMN-binding protein [Clostridia bacterium]|nr:FMN-binding protein [Clostridia bacterium]